ncbi:MAG: T9SS type A sorting domain-containing protein [Flavobacteriales bacterium]
MHAQFAAGVDITTGNAITKLHAVDFDGDDDMDVLLLDADVIAWVANDGTGQFGALTPLFTFGPDGGSFAVSDLDGNGTPDLVVRDAGTAQLSWFSNLAGDGVLGAEQPIEVGTPDGEVYPILCAQFIGTALPEVVVIHPAEAHLWVDPAAGSAPVEVRPLPGTGPFADAVGARAVDMDGSGRLDLVTSNSNGRVYAIFNASEVVSEWTTALLAVFYLTDFESFSDMLDVDADGDPDLIEVYSDRRWSENTLNEGGSTPFAFNISDGVAPIDRGLAAYLGCGGTLSVVGYHSDAVWRWTTYDPVLGNFAAPVDVQGLPVPTYEGTGDMDGDGSVDLLIVHDGTLSWYRNELPSVAPEPLPPIELDTICSTAVVPLPGDGTWYGFGVVDNVFDATIVGLGDQLLFYSDVDGTGCIATAEATLTIVEETVDPVMLGTYCIQGGLIDLPPPGTWSGPGVTNNVFEPGEVGTGEFELIHSVVTGLGCTVDVVEPIAVISSPVITPVLGEIDRCTTGVIQFTGVPAGGSWGATADEFGQVDTDALSRPFTGGVTYTYTDPNGTSCSNGGALTLWPLVFPVVGPHGPYCASDGPQTFTISGPLNGGVSVEDVEFLEVEVVSNSVRSITFDPSIGAGEYTFTASVSAPMACGQAIEVTIVVDPEVPDFTLAPFDTLCVATTDFPLGEGPIPGGTWSGAGVSDNTFTPVGPFEEPFMPFILTYTATSGACQAQAETIIRVGDPVIDDTGFVQAYCANGDAVQFNAQPSGGTWTPPVDATGLFDPATIMAQLPVFYNVLYTYVDPSGQACADALGPIVVNPLPEVALEYDLLCSNGPVFELSDEGTPVGGVYTLNGSSEPITELDPAVLTDATYELTYTYTDPGTQCTASVTSTFSVEVCSGLAENSAALDLRVYPNPSNDGTVRITTSVKGDLQLFDASGRVVWQQAEVPSGTPVEVHSLATGVYQVLVRNDRGVGVVRVVVQ